MTLQEEMLLMLQQLTCSLPELLEKMGYTDEEGLIERAEALISRAQAEASAAPTMREALEELQTFHRHVAKAAGDLDGLPDGHAFTLVDMVEEEEWSNTSDGFITAGMIRRAALKQEPQS